MWCCLHFGHACPTVRVCGCANARVEANSSVCLRAYVWACAVTSVHVRGWGGERRWTGNVIFYWALVCIGEYDGGHAIG